jgi:cytochrome c-type biogenesis protein CcmE
MTIKAKLFVVGAVLAAAVGYLAFAGMKSGWVYFLEVDHYLADAQYQNQRVRLHGKVADDRTFASSSASLTANFNLLGKSQKIAVAYHGTIPDLFQVGRDVVVEGRRDPATGTFNADMLMTKCASKYESSSPHATDVGGTADGAAGKERAS